MSSAESRQRSTQAAWDRVAAKYAAEFDSDVASLRAGDVSLAPQERRMLGDLSRCRLAIHLQCSHGQDALSLLTLGVHEVIGVDFSRQMLALAERKSELLGARARWVHADVLEVPHTLDGRADLVYTGKGALPWVSDLARWAGVVARLLKPGGRVYVHEGHPLNWVWDQNTASHQLSADGRGYFDRAPLANQDFPALAVQTHTPPGEEVAAAWEYQWTLGDVVSALSNAGLAIERLEEHAEQFWPQLRRIPDAELMRLPHSFSLVARLPKTEN
jgi:ubiquinone/menaquinone biosynthesis C-methylase UbiE